MFQKIRVIFSIPELRQKIILTLLLLAVYRIGWFIPIPIVDIAQMKIAWEGASDGFSSLMHQVGMFSGARFNNGLTIFGLGIMPYISASIIFQLLATVWEPLEKLRKEGESGRKKINEYTRYATVLICIIQSVAYVAALHPYYNRELMIGDRMPVMWIMTSVIVMTAGTTFLMWLGEQIDEYGIGNGISLLIMAGILANLPEALLVLSKHVYGEDGFRLGGNSTKMGVEMLLVLAVLFVAVVVGVIIITKGQRRISTQSAKHVRGRRTMGGTRQYLPLKVNQAGVMPIIFASSLLLFPQFLLQYFSSNSMEGVIGFFNSMFLRQSFGYMMMFIALIFFFCYFWTAISFNPKDMAENLKNQGSFIPGYRPGTWTADYLEKVMIRITYVGAFFLAIIAVLPNVVSFLVVSSISEGFLIASFFGGTSLLIVVSVIVDLVEKIDSHLVMRNYKGILEKSR